MRYARTRKRCGAHANVVAHTQTLWRTRKHCGAHAMFKRNGNRLYSHRILNRAVHGVGFLSKHSLGTRPLSGLGLAISRPSTSLVRASPASTCQVSGLNLPPPSGALVSWLPFFLVKRPPSCLPGCRSLPGRTPCTCTYLVGRSPTLAKNGGLGVTRIPEFVPLPLNVACNVN